MVQRKNGFLIFAWGMSLLAWVFKQDSLALGVEFLVMTGIVLIAIFLSVYRHHWNYLAVIKSAYNDPLLNFGTFIVIVLIPFYDLIPEAAHPAIAFLSSSLTLLALALPYLLRKFPPYTLKNKD